MCTNSVRACRQPIDLFMCADNSIVSNAANGNVTTATYGNTVNLSNTSGKKISDGALAGIIVGCVVFIGVIAAIAFLVIKLRNPRITESFTPSSGTQSPMAPGA